MEYSKRFYKAVAASSSEEDSYTPDNNKMIYVKSVGGSTVFENSVKVEIRWGTDLDYEIIFVTHGDIVHKYNDVAVLKADGTKSLKIILVNDSLETETIGGFYSLEEY
jgi:hypothetical protein